RFPSLTSRARPDVSVAAPLRLTAASALRRVMPHGSGAAMTPLRDVRGFSLTELVMVISLIAITAAMAVPLITGSSAQLELSAAARQVERELQSARMKAVRSNRVIRVRFN